MSGSTAAELIEHIREAILQVSIYLDGIEKNQFDSDKRTQQAVILNLIILGEAATKLIYHHPATIAQYPLMEWRSMRGMRNRIAHGYYDIDLDIVWETAKVSLPRLDALLAGEPQ